MGFFRWTKEHFGEIVLGVLLLLLASTVLSGMYMATPETRPIITFQAVFFMAMIFLVIGVIALFNRLHLKMGLRNLVRHKLDSLIAIVGFMVGTSIICSSFAIGDTMNDMIEDIVYEDYYLYDEYISVQDENGDPFYMNGSQAQEMTDIIWQMDDEKGLVDGVSWEVMETGAIIDMSTLLFEPMMTMRALSPETTDVFGGFSVEGKEVDYDLRSDQVYLTESAAEKLDAHAGDLLILSTGDVRSNFTVKAVVDQTGRASTFGRDNVFMTFTGLWSLKNISFLENGSFGSGGDWTGGHYTHLFISNEGGMIEGGELCGEVTSELETRFKDIPHPLGPNNDWEFNDNKKTSVDQSIESMDLMMKFFLVLGTFTIIAGITLIINIFVMLSEERKEEMGISRAIGMKRRHLRLLYLFEGVGYSVISSLIGVALGAVSGYLIILGFQSIMESMDAGFIDILSHYNVTPLSLILSFVSGFTITLGTTLFITWRISKLNIVSAIRNIPAPVKGERLVSAVQKVFGVYNKRECCGDDSLAAKAVAFLFGRSTILGGACLSFGALLLFIGIAAKYLWPVYTGLSVILIGSTLVLRHFINNRLLYSSVSIGMIVMWIVPTSKFFVGYSANMEMFILSGVFMVTSGVLLLIWNTDLIIWVAEKVISLIGLSPASFKTAISYPLKKRFRTGVTIFMFSLIIFTITVMSMLVNMFDVNIARMETSIGGGYDIIGISGTGIEDLQGAVTLGETTGPFDLEVSDDINWDSTVSLSIGTLIMNYSMPFMGMTQSKEMPYQCAGVSDRFIEKNSYGFSDVGWGLIDITDEKDKVDRNVWRALANPEFVIMNGNEMMGGFMMGGGNIVEVGSTIEVKDLNGTSYNKTVIAFTEQEGITAVFMSERTAEEEFGVTDQKIHLINVKGDLDRRDVANDLRKALLFYGFYTIIVRDMLEEMMQSINTTFDLLNAFLSLGLVVGIIGLGVVTLRAVYERRHEIGMMRAIGFRRSAVVSTFLGESAFIAGAGIASGIILGILVGWSMWNDTMKAILPVFGVPVVKLLMIGAIAFGFALFTSILPAMKAARVVPAEALRYE